jgi:ankyrin repeat protein
VSRLWIVLLVLPLSVAVGARDTPSIFWAAVANDVGTAQYYVSHGEPVDIFDEYGMTPLMYAADKGNLEMAMFLLRVGADPAGKSQDGVSAIDLAKTEEAREALRTMEQKSLTTQ